MNDLLASAALLVGAFGLIYSSWYPEIKHALEVPVPTYGRDPLLDEVRQAIRHRAAPTAAVAVILAMALVPPVWDVIAEALDAVGSGDAHYDPISACFVVVFLALVVLAFSSTRDLIRLLMKLHDLKKPVIDQS